MAIASRYGWAEPTRVCGKRAGDRAAAVVVASLYGWAKLRMKESEEV